MRALLLLALLPGAAKAQDLAESHFQMNFCYQQTFDSADLAAAPIPGAWTNHSLTPERVDVRV